MANMRGQRLDVDPALKITDAREQTPVFTCMAVNVVGMRRQCTVLMLGHRLQ